jgi:hypothetical protein
MATAAKPCSWETFVVFEDGRLLVYRTVGTDSNLRLSGPQWFDDTVPTGRIPRG